MRVARCIEVIERTAGRKPVSWYTGRVSLRTRRLVAGHGGFLCNPGSDADELPYNLRAVGRPLLVVAYNASRFGWDCGALQLVDSRADSCPRASRPCGDLL